MITQSIDFYTKLFGMTVKGRSRIEQTKGETVALEIDGGFTLELNYYDKNSPYFTEYTVGEGLDHLAFGVDNLNTTLENARKSGYRIISEMKANENRWAYIEDPNGIWIEVF